MSDILKVAGCAGHGYNTAGKRTPSDEREWSFNNKVILAFEKELLTYECVEFLRTDDRTGQTDIPLRVRTDKANAWNADMYISFHHNANTGKWGKWTGTETFYQMGSESGKKLATIINPAIIDAYKLTDRGVRSNNLHITRETKMPAALIEGGFMDSTIDIIKLRDDNVLEAAGKGVAERIAKAYGLKKKIVEKPIVESKPAINKADSYKVANGDTLWSIANKFDMKVDELKKLNNMKDDIIHIGDVLQLKKQVVKEHVKKPAPKNKYILPTGILEEGDSGQGVMQLQIALNAAKFDCGKPDGKFGPKTNNALKRFQSVYCNPADGIYGPKSRIALDKKVNG